VDAFGFVSMNSRDAVTNADSSFSSFITLYPRTDTGYNGLLLNPMLDQVKEIFDIRLVQE
jgi:hypothetical protein